MHFATGMGLGLGMGSLLRLGVWFWVLRVFSSNYSAELLHRRNNTVTRKPPGTPVSPGPVLALTKSGAHVENQRSVQKLDSKPHLRVQDGRIRSS